MSIYTFIKNFALFKAKIDHLVVLWYNNVKKTSIFFVILAMKYSIVLYGDPVLRKRSEEIIDFDDELKQFVNDLIKMMQFSKGIGIAAVQVGVLKRVFITQVDQECEDVENSPIRVYINPKITSYSDDLVTWNEGCLSIPKIHGEVTRPESISIEAYDINGNLFKENLSGWPARAFLHENDHINGVLFIDRMDKKDRKSISKALNNLKKR